MGISAPDPAAPLLKMFPNLNILLSISFFPWCVHQQISCGIPESVLLYLPAWRHLPAQSRVALQPEDPIQLHGNDR